MTFFSLTIRPFVAEDTPALSRIWRAASEQAHGFFSPQQLAEQQGLVETVYLANSETWVALQGREPVGFIGLLPDGRGAFVGGVFVNPTVQGQGIGRALLDHALALKSGLRLEVYEANTQARGFYASLGFRETGRREVDDNGLPFPLLKLDI